MNEVRLPLFSILSHSKGYNSIKSFARKEHSEETICFVKDVEEYRKTAKNQSITVPAAVPAPTADEPKLIKSTSSNGSGNKPPPRQYTQTELALQIWNRYKPGSDFAILWHTDVLKRIQPILEPNNSNNSSNNSIIDITDSYLFNAQEQIEIDNIKAGIMPRYYNSKEYTKFTDELLNELAVQLQESLAKIPQSAVLINNNGQTINIINNNNNTLSSTGAPIGLNHRNLSPNIDSNIEQKEADNQSPYQYHSMRTLSSDLTNPGTLTIIDNEPIKTGAAAAAIVRTGTMIGSKLSELSISGNSQFHSRSQLKYRSEQEKSNLLQYGFNVFHLNSCGREIIRKFMSSEYSVDNYDFVCAVENYQSRSMDNEELLREANYIYSFFLDENSKHEVTYPGELRTECTKQLQLYTNSNNNTNNKSIPINIFDRIYSIVLSTVKTDVFRRFVKSALYKIVAADLKDRYIKLKQQQKIQQKQLTEVATAAAAAAASSPNSNSNPNPTTNMNIIVNGTNNSGTNSINSKNKRDTNNNNNTQHSRRPSTLSSALAKFTSNKETISPDSSIIPDLTFTALLNDPDLVSSFINYSTREHSEELIMFYCDSKTYNRMRSAVGEFKDIPLSECLCAAQTIYENYIRTGSEFEIPISSNVRLSIENQLNLLTEMNLITELTPNLFTEASLYVFDLMKDDGFKRFLRSTEFNTVWNKKQSAIANTLPNTVNNSNKSSNNNNNNSANNNNKLKENNKNSSNTTVNNNPSIPTTAVKQGIFARCF